MGSLVHTCTSHRTTLAFQVCPEDIDENIAIQWAMKCSLAYDHKYTLVRRNLYFVVVFLNIMNVIHSNEIEDVNLSLFSWLFCCWFCCCFSCHIMIVIIVALYHGIACG